MIVDFHTHVLPDTIASVAIKTLEDRAHIKAYTAGTESALYASMCNSSVDISIVLPVVTNPLKTNHFNDFAAEMNARYAADCVTVTSTASTNGVQKNSVQTKKVSGATRYPRIISFAGIHPDTVDIPTVIKDIALRGVKGIKLHPDYQKVNFDDDRYERIVAEAEKYNLITVVHAGIDIGLPEPVHCTPKMARKVIDDVHPAHLVLAHMGGWKLWDDVEQLLVGQNVFFDTAFTDTYLAPEQFVRIVHNHGAERILFGTDSPWSGQRETIAMINGLPLTAAEKQLILGGNAQRLLNV